MGASTFLETVLGGQERTWVAGGSRGYVLARVIDAPDLGQVLDIEAVDLADGTRIAPARAHVDAIHDEWQLGGGDEQLLLGELARLYGALLPDASPP